MVMLRPPFNDIKQCDFCNLHEDFGIQNMVLF